jgi:hypothetical protein
MKYIQLFKEYILCYKDNIHWEVEHEWSLRRVIGIISTRNHFDLTQMAVYVKVYAFWKMIRKEPIKSEN